MNDSYRKLFRFFLNNTIFHFRIGFRINNLTKVIKNPQLLIPNS
jgi:1-acyl-sn-glycerol-3-phosphate acyltransferase